MPRASEVSSYMREVAEAYLAAYHTYMATDSDLPEFAAAEQAYEAAAKWLALFAVDVILGKKVADAARTAALAAGHESNARFDARRAAREAARLAESEKASPPLVADDAFRRTAGLEYLAPVAATEAPI